MYTLFYIYITIVFIYNNLYLNYKKIIKCRTISSRNALTLPDN